jgi:hypothetical protein
MRMTQISMKVQVFCYVTATLGEYCPMFQMIVYLLLQGLALRYFILPEGQFMGCVLMRKN